MTRRQIRECSVHLQGVQEARGTRGSRTVDGFIILSSGAVRGCLGCELWARADMPYARLEGKEFYFRLKDFAVLHADPRLLVVRVTARMLQCTVAVGHAPHSGHPLEEREAWWDDLVKVLAGQPDLVLMVDANGRLGSVCSEAVGQGGFRQEEDASGALFHRSLLELGLRATSTWGPPDPAGFTWVAPRGQRHRIDFIATPLQWGSLEGLGGQSHTLIQEQRASWRGSAAECRDEDAVGADGTLDKACPGGRSLPGHPGGADGGESGERSRSVEASGG